MYFPYRYRKMSNKEFLPLKSVYCIKTFEYSKRYFNCNNIYSAFIETDTIFVYSGEIDQFGDKIGLRFSFKEDVYLHKFSDYFAVGQELRKIKLNKISNEK